MNKRLLLITFVLIGVLAGSVMAQDGTVHTINTMASLDGFETNLGTTLMPNLANSKLDGQLFQLNREYTAYLNGGSVGNFQTNIHNLAVQSGDYVLVDFVTRGDADMLLPQLQALGLQGGVQVGRLISGRLPIGAIGQLETMDNLQLARYPMAIVHNAGSVDNQANPAMQVDTARSLFNVDGTGMTIGVLSDSFDNLGGYATDVGTGDLPAGVNVLDDLASGGSDEGRAMAQLIYDLAPNSSLAFHSAFNGGEAGFAQGILDLATAGSDVIVDDVSYFTEPFFQDGVVAQAVDNVVAQGIPYFSSAGNQATQSYESAFRDSGQLLNYGGKIYRLHDFDPGAGTDVLMDFTLDGSGTSFTISFQWDEPFASAGGAGSASDMDLILVDSGFTTPYLATSTNNVGGDAVEVTGIGPYSGSPLNVAWVIGVVSTDPIPTHIKFLDYDGQQTYEYFTNSSTINAHANSATGAGVAAARYDATPFYGTTPPVAEYFTSLGGTQIYFDTAGNRLGSPVSRNQPRFTAVDGTDTTFFGQDYEPNGDPNFFGTSAAAPHAAALAALMLEVGSTQTPAQIYAAMESTAIDMNTGGFDYLTGYGLVQADVAICGLYTFPYTLGTVDAGDLVQDLRAAMECADANGTADTIDLNGQTVTFTDSYGNYDGATALPDIIKQLTIQNGTLIRSGSNEFRFLFVSDSIYSASLTLDNVVLDNGGGSTYSSFGGAILAGNNTSLTIKNSTLQNNTTSAHGGAIDAVDSLVVENSTFLNNQGSTGGAIIVWGTMKVSNSIFQGNQTTGGSGGAIYVTGEHSIVNSLFTGNYATGDGGAILDNRNGNAYITNTTIAGNTATGLGGGVYRYQANGRLYITNSILYGNSGTGADVYNVVGSVHVSYSLYGTATGITDLGNNSTSDPLFTAPEPAANAPTTAGDYTLQNSSPALNVGNNSADPDGGGSLPVMSDVSWTDLAGNARIQNTTIDMGAYESAFVDPNTTISGTIQDASGGNMEFITVRLFEGSTINLLDSTCTDGSGAYSFTTAYVGTVDIVAGNLPTGSCTHPTIEYDQQSSTVDTSTGSSFVVNLTLTPDQAPFLAPILSTPTGVQTTQTPTFTWNRIVNATAYQIQVAGDASPLFTVTEDEACAGSSTCSYTPDAGSALPYALTTYNAMIRAANSLGDGSWGGTTYFGISPSINTPSGGSTILAPAEASINSLTPTLEWTPPISGASHYDIYALYQTYSEYITVSAVDANCSPNCSYVLTAQEGYTGFRILPKNYNGYSGWSSARYFYTTAATGVATPPTLTSPTGTVNTTTTTITWNFEAGVNRYSIYTIQPSIYGSTFTNIDAQALCPGYPNATTCSFDLNTQWSGSYTVQLNGRNPYGWSGYGISNVDVDLNPPDGIMDAPTWLSDSIIRTDRSFPLAWSEVEGAISYTLVMYNPLGMSDAQVYNSSVCSAGICTVIYDVDTNGLYAAYVRATGLSSESPFALSSFPVRLLDAPSIGLPIVDADNDGIDDSFDNCTTVANVEQLDRDGDGIGAACDWNDSPSSLPSVGSDDDTNPNDGGRGLPGAPSNP